MKHKCSLCGRRILKRTPHVVLKNTETKEVYYVCETCLLLLGSIEVSPVDTVREIMDKMEKKYFQLLKKGRDLLARSSRQSNLEEYEGQYVSSS